MPSSTERASNTWLYDPPAYLPPRQHSLPDLKRKTSGPFVAVRKSSRDLKQPPLVLPPQPPSYVSTNAHEKGRWTSRTDPEKSYSPSERGSRSTSYTASRNSATNDSPASNGTVKAASFRHGLTELAAVSERPPASVSADPLKSPRLNSIQNNLAPRMHLPAPTARRLQILRHSSLRIESKLSEQGLSSRAYHSSVLRTAYSNPTLGERPHSHPPMKRASQPYNLDCNAENEDQHPFARSSDDEDQLRLPPLLPSARPTSTLSPRPRASIVKLSSLDNLISYREDKAQWKRASSVLQQRMSAMVPSYQIRRCSSTESQQVLPVFTTAADQLNTEEVESVAASPPSACIRQGRFRHVVAEIGFCFTIAMTQFLAEYLISGFAIELPRLLSAINSYKVGPGSMGDFWPASLCSLILSATLLVFARLSDLYGGYYFFLMGNLWLAIWTLLPGFFLSNVMLDVSRAMQGLAIAVLTPSTFAMVGSIYAEGPRRNIVLGLYGACAPLGFYAGFLAAGALPENEEKWYFWIASILAFVTAITAYLTVPHDRTNRQALGLKMDWLGGCLITAGLILVAYALAVEPYANEFEPHRNGFSFPMVLGPLVSGLACLSIAVWVEGWYAASPLLPFDFFRPRGVAAFCLACLFFYGCFGVWLYNSAIYFEDSWGTSGGSGTSGIMLALWYTPAAIGGIIFCVVGGALLHIIPIKVLLILSGLAWVGAPLVLALSPVPLKYWTSAMPSTLCATLGIDLTFTISTVFLSSSQPLRYQGLAGAVCSILVNLAMSFSLSISEIVQNKASGTIPIPNGQGIAAWNAAMEKASIWGLRATFIYAATSAAVGLLIVIFFVRISRSVVRERPGDEESPRATSSEASTLVEEAERGGQQA